jgi:mycothiol synthase
MGTDALKRQLEMLWPEGLRRLPLRPRAPRGYSVRPYRPGDELGFFRVMELAGFKGWDAATLRQWLDRVLPDGLIFVVHRPTGVIVASAMAAHRPNPDHPFGGELGWVAGDPAHRGKGLGLIVCAAAVNRFLRAGYRRIYLKTDDHRLPAIKTYLKLGFLPRLFQEDMAARWAAVCQQLSWPFTPDRWPRR